MKKIFYFISMFFSFLISVQFMFAQASVKVEFKNSKIKYKSFNYQPVRENAVKVSLLDNNDEEITGLQPSDFKITKHLKEAYKIELTPLSKIGDTKVRHNSCV